MEINKILSAQLIPWMTSALLCILLGVSIINFNQQIKHTYTITPDGTTYQNQAASSSAADTRHEKTLNISRIATWSLFGKNNTQSIEAPRIVSAPKTNLNLKLRGIVYSDKDGSARAIVAGPDGKEAMHPVGAKIPGSAIIEYIYADRIILLRNKGYETLYLRSPNEQKAGH